MKVQKEQPRLQDPAAERRTWTIEEAAQILGISMQSAYEAARKGRIPVVRMGRRLLVPRAALDAMLARPSAQTPGDQSVVTD